MTEIPAWAQDAPDFLAAPDENPEAIPATVTIVDDIGDYPDYYSVSQESFLYTYWKIDNLYKTRGMKVQMPIANAPEEGLPNYAPTSAIVTLSGPQTIRIIRVTAERMGTDPEFPDPNNLPQFPLPTGLSPSQGIAQTFLKSKILPGTPEITVLGQKLYRASAEYYIALSRAPNPGEQLALGNDRWTNFGDQATSISGALTNSDWSSSE